MFLGDLGFSLSGDQTSCDIPAPTPATSVPAPTPASTSDPAESTTDTSSEPSSSVTTTSPEASSEVQTAQTVTQGVLAAGVLASVVAAGMSMSSPQGAFSIVNQFQLLILIPLAGTYLPEDVIAFITGMDFTMFSFDFIPFEDIPMIHSLTGE